MQHKPNQPARRLHAALALALGTLAAGAAQAQSSVTVYGILDTAVTRVTNANAAGDAVTKMPSLTGSLPSRIGFRGTEELGNGLAAVFTLESGIAPDSGAMGQGNRLFGRQASVGLKGRWGTLTLGRQANMTFHATLKSDVLGPNLFAIGSIDPYIPNARSDNAIGYLGNFDGIVAGATYSLGRDTSSAGGPAATGCAGESAADARACRQYTALLGYEMKGYGINVSYDKLFGGTGAGGGLAGSGHYDRRAMVNGYYLFGATKLGGGVMLRKTSAATGVTESTMAYLGASHPLSAFLVLDAQVARKDVKRSGDDSTMVVTRLTYLLSTRTAVYCAVGRMDNDGAAAIALDAGGTAGPGKAQTGVMTGLRHLF
ncbi:porin [Pseudoduganella umbonata]|uniref:Porin n=1 Tax=Pseudoduganella umbonata TaxID=864828 RepID=A0A4P8HMK2_9BURK|nr:porin [Pseudoduganella umbonata]MBB3219514.1 putative porin [Pseudoduganella umbonata]QCP09592.1 porin [Pseudoduganella umbonata]